MKIIPDSQVSRSIKPTMPSAPSLMDRLSVCDDGPSIPTGRVKLQQSRRLRKSGESMRIFEPLQEMELFDGERLVGVYTPGLRYNCWDDATHAALANVLDQWLADGAAKLFEQREGTQPAAMLGQGEIE
jgi:hypothetical protein